MVLRRVTSQYKVKSFAPDHIERHQDPWEIGCRPNEEGPGEVLDGSTFPITSEGACSLSLAYEAHKHRAMLLSPATGGDPDYLGRRYPELAGVVTEPQATGCGPAGRYLTVRRPHN